MNLLQANAFTSYPFFMENILLFLDVAIVALALTILFKVMKLEPKKRKYQHTKAFILKHNK